MDKIINVEINDKTLQINDEVYPLIWYKRYTINEGYTFYYDCIYIINNKDIYHIKVHKFYDNQILSTSEHEKLYSLETQIKTQHYEKDI